MGRTTVLATLNSDFKMIPDAGSTRNVGFLRVQPVDEGASASKRTLVVSREDDSWIESEDRGRLARQAEARTARGTDPQSLAMEALGRLGDLGRQRHFGRVL